MKLCDDAPKPKPPLPGDDRTVPIEATESDSFFRFFSRLRLNFDATSSYLQGSFFTTATAASKGANEEWWLLAAPFCYCSSVFWFFELRARRARKRSYYLVCLSREIVYKLVLYVLDWLHREHDLKSQFSTTMVL